MDRHYQPRLCVRCGRRPRSEPAYLCGLCLTDPLARAEAAEVARAGGTYTEQRRVAIEVFHWAGGWGHP